MQVKQFVKAGLIFGLCFITMTSLFAQKRAKKNTFKWWIRRLWQ